MQEDWRIPGSGLKKKRLLPGDPWPKTEPIHTEAVDICASCGVTMKGLIQIEIDEHGEPVKVYSVKEIGL